jgi:RNA recognition motif-containing protein
MESSDQAQVAIKAMNGQYSNGRALTVNEARPREDRGSSKNSNGPEGVGTSNLVEKMGRINFNFSAVRNLFQRRLPSSRDNSVTPRAV